MCTHIDFPDTSRTLRLAYTGHDLCEAEDGQCNSKSPLGVTYKTLGLALVMDIGRISIATQLTVHEFGHFLEAPDHYGGDNTPTTDEINSGTTGAPYSLNCIYSEDRYSMDESDDDTWLAICDGCQDDIRENIDLYDHSMEVSP